MRQNSDFDYIMVSACLLGSKVRYDGKEKRNNKIIELVNFYNIIPICPEVDGGLPCPRDPCEIINGKPTTKNGKDCSKEYILGAEKALRLAQNKKIKFAILKENSPSCGVNNIYDGSFNSKLIKGNGITAKKLIEAGIKVYTETDIDELLSNLRRKYNKA